jgi:hypothetical protein
MQCMGLCLVQLLQATGCRNVGDASMAVWADTFDVEQTAGVVVAVLRQPLQLQNVNAHTPLTVETSQAAWHAKPG